MMTEAMVSWLPVREKRQWLLCPCRYALFMSLAFRMFNPLGYNSLPLAASQKYFFDTPLLSAG